MSSEYHSAIDLIDSFEMKEEGNCLPTCFVVESVKFFKLSLTYSNKQRLLDCLSVCFLALRKQINGSSLIFYDKPPQK